MSWLGGSASGLEPERAVAEHLCGRNPDWVCCDVGCYPERLFGLIDRWRSLSFPYKVRRRRAPRPPHSGRN